MSNNSEEINSAGNEFKKRQVGRRKIIAYAYRNYCEAELIDILIVLERAAVDFREGLAEANAEISKLTKANAVLETQIDSLCRCTSDD